MKLLSFNDLEPLFQADPHQRVYTLNRYFKPLQKIPYLKRLQMVSRIIGDKKYEKFLDIGFGSGIFLPELAERSKNLTAIDIHPHINIVKKIIDSKDISADIIKADVLNLPFPDNTFDGILCLSVLEFINDTSRAVQEIKRVAKPRAKIIIGAPVLNHFTDLCYKIIHFKQSSEMHKTDHKKIINSIRNNNLQIKKIITFPKFLLLDFSLFFVLESTKL